MGCGKKGDEGGQAQQNPQGGQQGNPDGGQPQQPDPRGTGIGGVGDRVTVENDMKNLGLFYKQYALEHGKGPPNLQAFTASMGNEGRSLARKFEQKQYGMLVVPRPNASTVVIYEVAGDTAGNHYVVMGDGSQKTMKQSDLQKLWKAKN
jgi:hypothetical protein